MTQINSQIFHRKTYILTVLLIYHGVLVVLVLLEVMEMVFVISASDTDINDLTNCL